MKLKPITLKVPKKFQYVLFTTLATSWISGLTFFILNQFVMIEGDFGPQKHPLQFPMISIHGFAAFMMMILFGAMIANHVPLGWKSNRLRLWGLTFLIAVTLQILTGYTLYYLATDFSREVIGYVHLAIGILLPVILTKHILAAITEKRKRPIKQQTAD